MTSTGETQWSNIPCWNLQMLLRQQKQQLQNVNRAAYVLINDTPFGPKMSDWFSETAMFTGTS